MSRTYDSIRFLNGLPNLAVRENGEWPSDAPYIGAGWNSYSWVYQCQTTCVFVGNVSNVRFPCEIDWNERYNLPTPAPARHISWYKDGERRARSPEQGTAR